MAAQRRKTIAIIMGNAISAYSTELVEGFQACAREEDVNLIFLKGPHVPQYCKDVLSGSFAWDYEYQFHTVYDYVHHIKPDALIIAYGLLSQFKYVPDINEFVKRFEGIPCLIVGDKVDNPNIPFFTGGNCHGMRENIEHLINVHGYKKIGFVAGPRRNFDSNQRLEAYKAVMAEHGLEVEDTMIVFGNYSEVADAEVEELLDKHPDLEAIVFANDSMAKAGYRVCAARDLVVGHDIAITGYDDSDVAKTLEPPLTSVAHSSFLFSYRAVQAALKLCNGEMPESEDLEAQFHKRASCGCKPSLASLKSGMSLREIKGLIEKRVESMVEEIFAIVPYGKDKEKYRMLLELYFTDIVDMVFAKEKEENISFELLLRYLQRLCEEALISKRLLIEHIESVIKELMDFSENKWKQNALASILIAMQQYIHAAELHSLELEKLQADRRNWFIPSFTMDLITEKLDLREQMLHVMNRLQAMGVKSGYLLLFRGSVIHKKGEPMEYPEEMYLTAHFGKNGAVCYQHGDMPVVNRETGFTHLIDQDSLHFYTAFPLFSGEEQYGLILCEAEQKDYMFMLICSMQLGSLRRIIDMNLREQKMKQELEEKNQILSVMSAYDELSKLLNRRGFMEKAIQAIREGEGKKGCIIFADIDHLKEINDCFGHAAGDFAIITAADYLRHCMPEHAVIARIGGDEYVALVIEDENCSGECEVLTKKLTEHSAAFNANSSEPFYVEMSAGLYPFVCNKNVDIPEILKHSDEVLYEKKKNRRTTIKKCV